VDPKPQKMAPTARAERSTIGRNQPAGQLQQTQKRYSSGQNQQQRWPRRAPRARQSSVRRTGRRFELTRTPLNPNPTAGLWVWAVAMEAEAAEAVACS